MIAALAALAVSPAFGAGYHVLDPGVRAYARGGAYVAGASDLSAMTHNPAALIRLEGGRARFDLSGVNQSIRFERADGVDGDGAPVVYEAIENEADPYLIPAFAVSSDFGTERWVLALGFYPPYAPELSYPADGPQRYTLISSALVQTQAGPSAAFRAHPWVTVGAGLQWQLLQVSQELVLTTSGEDEPRDDIRMGVNATDPFALSGNLGVLVEPPAGRWALAASIQLPSSFSGEGSLAGDFSNHRLYERGIITDPTVLDDAITLDVRMPAVLRWGALVRPVEGLEIELAGHYEGWSSIEEFVVDDVDLTIQTTLGPSTITEPVSLPANYNDAWSLRLGGEYAWARWALRAGGFFESSAVPPETQGVGLVDGPKLGYGLGGSATAGRFTLDVGWSQGFLQRREITDSEISQVYVDVFTGEVDDGLVVGNGRFVSRHAILGAAVNMAFGRRADEG